MFNRRRKVSVDTPNLWVKCESCGEVLFLKDLEANLKVCPKCQYHFKLTSRERVNLFLDGNSFQELDSLLAPIDPLNFGRDYPAKLLEDQKKTGLKDAVLTGFGTMDGVKIALGVMDFHFRGGSMGSVVGEKITRVIEFATKEQLPVIVVAASGGARMQEGTLSLMQMAKTSAAVARHMEEGLLYISVMSDPTTAGVAASFASLGDLVFAEPGALIGFTGQRVIEQTIRQKLPPGFQRSEFFLKHGMIDMVLERKYLKRTIIQVLQYWQY